MKLTVILFFAVFVLQKSRAQYITHDVGFLFGTTKLQTDYGQRGDFKSSFGNGSTSLSIVYYLHFFNSDFHWTRKNSFINRIAIKTELSHVFNAEINHYGKWVNKTGTDLAEQLSAMYGEISMFNIGVQLEYYLIDLRTFIDPYSDIIKWNPFISVGFSYVSYKNNLFSDLGDWRSDISVLPYKYRDPEALAIGSGNALSLIASIGTRYKLSKKIDLVTQFQMQAFFSDAIDGLNSNTIEDKNNEWMVNLQFGLVYHLNFHRPLFGR